MKKIFYFLLAVALLLGSCAQEDKIEKTGSIYGVITDKATGEPIRAAGVQLNPLGTKTVTGNEGQYEFTELKAGEYTLQVTKTGYTDLLNYKITVTAGKTNKGDVQIEKLPPSLRVVNDNKQDISELDFGSAEADLARSFSVFNDGENKLEWEITKTSDWITTISKTSGTLNAGATQAIIVTIDRSKLATGNNTTTIHITSDNGSKQLTIKATYGRIKPKLNTLETTNIAATRATFNGEIMDVGVPTYTERGFVYATTTEPTLETTIAKRTVEVTNTATFSTNVLDLTLGKTYFVRAYAINSEGTAYSSNENIFTTVAALPTLTTQTVSNISIANERATFNGIILTNGDPAYTERGFVYGTVHNPTVEDDMKKIAAGSGIGAFSVNATEIKEGATYYVRAYAINAAGTAYGDEVTLNFNAVPPEVNTQAVTNITGSGSATFNGMIITSGDPAYTERGFVYGNMKNPAMSGTKKPVAGTGIGAYNLNVTGMQEGTTYYVHAYATNVAGTVYGEEMNFNITTVMPQVTTQAVTNITSTTATFNGTIVNAGDPAYTEKGFVYSTSYNPIVEVDTKKIVTGTSSGSYSINVTGINMGILLYVRAYASTSKGTVYGEEVSFTPNSPNTVALLTAELMVQKTDIGIGNLNSMITLCQNSTLDGYTGWRVPTKAESAVLFANRDAIGGFNTNYYYWTSTLSRIETTGWGYGVTKYFYWVQDFKDGGQYDYSWLGDRDNEFRCRCVRTLP